MLNFQPRYNPSFASHLTSQSYSKANISKIMHTSVRPDIEDHRLIEIEKANMRTSQATSKETAWDTFRRNIYRRRQQLSSPSSSLQGPKNDADERPYSGPRPEDKEESKFGEALLDMMQRSGRFNYCDFGDSGHESKESQESTESEKSQESKEHRRRWTLDSTWRKVSNRANQAPRFVHKAVSSPR